MNEFELIAKYLKPLAEGAPGALGLADDAAVLSVPAGHELVLTADAIVAGIHFVEDDPLDLIARKLLRVNVSDLAAKGAQPLGYLLACCWPRRTREAEVATFARGLAEDQSVYGLNLLGGDTTVTDGPLTLSLTALGTVPCGHMLRRSGARPGDKLFVTGTIGDAGLGLKVVKGEDIGASAEETGYLSGRYRLPEPHLSFGLAARDHILAAVDVSDGLLADAGHIAAASGVGVKIELAKLPLSQAASAWVRRGGSAAFLATAGDDYEICFAAAEGSVPALRKAAEAAHTSITEVGTVVAGAGARLIGPDGKPLSMPQGGFDHFRSAFERS